MYEKAPANIHVGAPMSYGNLASISNMQAFLKKLLEENEEIKRQTTEKKQAAVLKVEQHLCKIRQNLGIQKNQPDYPAEENRRQTADNRLNFRTNGGEFGDRQTTR